ncbi:conserved hypothetical protein [Chloroherpeton thalassium ATCC 35110]|uniref:DUF1343 domain-containing protein n=1 Tax=Chloroherpeton thalassium (strain ATCC 35110 / GB-78) TaxID=517418 RepID=B3QUD2_CHLT3|nr:DUF1343 domain-containing protein [Chloroherpeton thalassium]ACF14381.1 conserved hypothetical protein [Chloroherpeton thalassium ATCC 35110]
MNVFKKKFSVLFVVCCLFVFNDFAYSQLRTGLDVLVDFQISKLKGKNVALITNKTGVDRFLTNNYELLRQNNVTVKKIFTPEHGFLIDKEAGKKVENSTIDDIQVISLYGWHRAPTKDELQGISVLIYDIQDVGVRCFTYISTMKLAMNAANDNKIEFIVLDRPNPISPLHPDGFMVDSSNISFVSSYNIPFIYGLTSGELAKMIKDEEYPELSLTIYEMLDYNRKKYDDEQFRWVNNFIPPSPNLQDFESVLLYPATVFLEGTNISEGRGTSEPFKQFGAPFIIADDVVFQLRILKIDGVYFEETSFTPRSIEGISENPKYENEKCYGIKIKVINRKEYNPFQVAVGILFVLQKLYPNEFDMMKYGSFFDKLVGTNKLRKMLRDGVHYEDIIQINHKQITEYQERIKKYIIY